MSKSLLLINLGTPDKPTYFSVFKYLRQFLMDGRVININPILTTSKDTSKDIKK